MHYYPKVEIIWVTLHEVERWVEAFFPGEGMHLVWFMYSLA